MHRAFHAMPPLSTSQGELINAVYGFTVILLGVLRDLKPSHAVVAFDLPEPTFRHKLYPEYKAHRPETDPDLVGQLGRVKEVVAALQIPLIELAGYEADDVIGTIASQIERNGVQEILVVTGDKDMFQLVTDKTHVVYSRGKANGEERFDPAGVRSKFGFAPELLIDYKALRGDPSDNIPGVRGVGDKTATALVKSYGMIETLYDKLAADALTDEKPRTLKLLSEQREQAFLSKKLATIDCAIPLDFQLEASRLTLSADDQVVELFRQLEFRRLVAQVQALVGVGEDTSDIALAPPASAPAPTEGGAQQTSLFGLPGMAPESSEPAVPRSAIVEGETHCVGDMAELPAICQKIRDNELLVFDTETTGLDPLTAELVGISLGAEPGIAYYLPLNHTAGQNLPRQAVLDQLAPLFADTRIRKVAHNFKYDAMILQMAGIEIANYFFDTLLAAYLLHPGLRAYGLKDLAFTELGWQMNTIEELIGPKGKSQKSFAEVTVEQAAPYAGADVLATCALFEIFAKRLEEVAQTQAKGENGGSMDKVFHEIEMPLLPVLVQMELTGIAIDRDFLSNLSDKLGKSLQALEKEIHTQAGETFNINSTQQLSEILFNKLGIRKTKRTKTGLSTDADSLGQIRAEHPIVDFLLQFRELSKLRNTYVDALPPLIHPRTGRVHTSFNQAVTSTGRLSSSNPNLQNIPIRTAQGREIRKAFIAEAGHLLLAADYSQMEFRILSHMAQDETMIAAFRAGTDFHTTTAAGIFDCYPEQVTSEQRRIAKTVNFGVIYGQSKYGLSRQLGISVEEAEQFIQQFFQRFSATAAFLEKIKLEARTKGYVSTLAGRVRHLPELRSKAVPQQLAGERMAINMPIQGTAADIMKIAMIDLHHALQQEKLRSRLVLQVHDEVVLEVPEAEVEKAAALVRKTLSEAFELSVPLDVEVEVGKNWGEMEGKDGMVGA